MLNITETYCLVDDFCKIFFPQWNKHLIDNGIKRRSRKSKISQSEIMTILILFHQSDFRTFKHFYIGYVCVYMKSYFPELVSYNRFIELQKSVLVPLYYFSQTLKGEKTGVYFIDSTTIEVCHIKREKQNKVFKDLAEKSKSTKGWFFGFKLHLVINNKGEIMAFKLTKARTDDRAPIEELTKGLTGKMVGDKGYIDKELSDNLFARGLKLITKIKKNMKNSMMSFYDKLLLKKRGLIETVNDQLKNICQIEHTRHRSICNFLTNLISGLISYALKAKKPSVNINMN